MNLVPWRRDERNPLTSLQHEMNRLFDDFFNGGRSLLRSMWANSQEGFFPAVDVRETDDKYIIEAELPGMDPKDVQIRVEGDVLRISGERKEEKVEKTRAFHRTERSYGRFERQLALGPGIDPDRVEATYKNGVLTVEVAKNEKVKPKTIPVKVKGGGPAGSGPA